MEPADRQPRRGKDSSKVLAEKGWYHSFELPDGTRIEGYNPIEVLRQRYARFPIAEDLHGKRVLDIGAWDGWFSFEAERRGAAVTAIDYLEIPNFLDLRRRLCSKVDYRILDFYEIPAAALGTFDIVFFLGILYHLKHPLLALEVVCALTTDIAIVESFVTDAETWRDHQNEIPSMEFYETDELGNQLDNWTGPTVGCLQAMCRAAGFARAELLHASGRDAVVACFRKWELPPEEPLRAAPEVFGVANTKTSGINFHTRKEEYVSCWFQAAGDRPKRQELRFEIDGFGVPALSVSQVAGGLLANFRLPPGLTPGWKQAALRFANSGFGKAFPIAVDLPLEVSGLELKGVRDAITWTSGEIKAADGYLAAWVAGLPVNCDLDNVRAFLGESRLSIQHIGEEANGCRQVNAALPADTRTGEHSLRIECGGVSTATWPLKIV